MTSFIPRHEALDASDVNVYAHVSSSESWDTFKKGLVQRTQRVHELFRHLFSLMQKARRDQYLAHRELA